MTIGNWLTLIGIVVGAFVTILLFLVNRYLNSLTQNAENNIKLEETEKLLHTVSENLLEISSKMSVLTTKFENIEKSNVVFLQSLDKKDEKLDKQQEQINKLELKITNYISGHQGNFERAS